jgi:hypothetical protein
MKPLGQIKRNSTGSIYGRSFIRFPHFILIGQKHGRHDSKIIPFMGVIAL